MLSWSGRRGNPITYDGNSAGTWGTGRAVFTDHHKTYGGADGPWFFYTDSARSYITFRNLEFAEIAGSATIPTDEGSPVARNSGAAIVMNATVNGVRVEDCVFHEIGYHWNEKPMNSAAISGTGLQVIGSSGDGLVVTNCDFSRMNLPLELVCPGSGTMKNITVQNSKFHDSIRWCVDIAPLGQFALINDIIIENCEFYDYHQFDQLAWTGYGEWPHTDGIFFRCDYHNVSFGTNVHFRNNLFYNTQSAGGGGTASIYITEGPSANVYNNLFMFTGKTRTISFANGP